MCMEDVRLGRRQNQQHHLFTLSTTVVEILPFDPYRTCIVFGPDDTIACGVGTRSDISATTGIQLPIDGQPVILDIQHHGALVTAPWYAVSASGTPTISVLTSRLPED